MKLRFLIFIGCLFFAMEYLHAAPPATLTYQGRLKSAQGVPVNTPSDIIFRIYDVETGGTKLWEESHTGVTIANGIFTVILGKTVSLATLPFDKTYYMSIEPNKSGEMSPRMEMTSAPYAMNTVKQSSVGSADTYVKAITTPKNVTISPSASGQASVTWNAVDGATSYNLYLATESGVNASNYTSKANGKAITGVTSPYTVTGLTNGTQYFFSMTAVTPVGESVTSVEGKTIPSALSKVAKTGQTTSYAANDDGALQPGVSWPSPRFTDNSNGTVTDNLTGLIWLKNASCFGLIDWNTSLNKANTLANSMCGLNDNSVAGDWRLPNVNEMRSLINHERGRFALPSGYPFTNVQAGYRTSTTDADYTLYAWGISIEDGHLNHNPKSNPLNIWPVRNGQCASCQAKLSIPQTGQITSYGTGDDGALRKGTPWPTPRFTDRSDGTIFDALTNLVWLKNANCFGSMTWNNALIKVNDFNNKKAQCTGYNGTMTDWRLPSIYELESLIDYGRSQSAFALDNPFTDTESHSYWSSTTAGITTSNAYVVYNNRFRVGRQNGLPAKIRTPPCLVCKRRTMIPKSGKSNSRDKSNSRHHTKLGNSGSFEDVILNLLNMLLAASARNLGTVYEIGGHLTDCRAEI
ncbi:MAG: DUF1566 domain-containing protein [Magnetococcus sp. YQC-5]